MIPLGLEPGVAGKSGGYIIDTLEDGDCAR